MNWYDWPAIVFVVAFVVSLSPARRWSHYLFAITIATICGVVSVGLVLLVWGITR